MGRDKVITADEAMQVILSGDTIATGGFVGIGFPEHLAVALERRFLETGEPGRLTLIFAAGQGDGKAKGLNHFGHKGMVERAIGGHWGLAPTLGALALNGDIDAYCLPQGVISHWFRDIAAGRPGTLTDIGIGTFIDPRLEGGRLNSRSVENIVELVKINGAEHLFVPSRRIDVALLRGTTADPEGNITMEREAVTLETLSIAQAVKNSGGLVIVQVERTTTRRVVSPREVKIPGILVDAVVLSPPEHHQQTFAESFNPAYTGDTTIADESIPSMTLTPRKVIARRAAMFLSPNSVVNLGIGIPEGIASVAKDEGILHLVTLTVEAGGIGGIPAGGLSFGATSNAEAIIDQPYQFDFYDGGGLDQAFLGMAEADADGNVNVSRFGTKIAGPGGFINISQSTKEVYFLGLFRAGAKLAITDGRLQILEEGKVAKFQQQVGQVTFSGEYARQRGQTVYYITERCVFKLAPRGLELVEVAPGLDIERDIIEEMAFRPIVSDELTIMDPEIFAEDVMGLWNRPPQPLGDRFTHDAEQNVLFCNFEGITLNNPDDVAPLAQTLNRRFEAIGTKVHVVVNYDNFEVSKQAEPAFFDMIATNQRFVLSRTRYSTNAFFRRRLGQRFTSANLEHRLYGNFADARDALRPASTEGTRGLQRSDLASNVT